MEIFVSNLGFGVDREELLQHFAQYGEVTSVTIATDKFTNRSKGYAFVEMKEEEQGARAIDGLNGLSIAGRTMKVEESKSREERFTRRNTGRIY